MLIRKLVKTLILNKIKDLMNSKGKNHKNFESFRTSFNNISIKSNLKRLYF